MQTSTQWKRVKFLLKKTEKVSENRKARSLVKWSAMGSAETLAESHTPQFKRCCESKQMKKLRARHTHQEMKSCRCRKPESAVNSENDTNEIQQEFLVS